VNQIQFSGEMLWPGNLGQFFIVLCTVASLGAAWYYFRAANKDLEQHRLLGRRLFYLQAFSVLAIFGILFWIIFKHRYEYYYAWRHSSNALPVYYMISCFWEGQEGSFLLWMFWNAVLGLILTRKAGQWEGPVMAVISFIQLGLSTMVLGLGQGTSDWVIHIGSSPFDLLREQRPDFLQIPVMGTVGGPANYLQIFKDGNGLNQLLQNYWMVIHPPTLFLGFATAMVPFAYSIAGLWKNNDRGWVSPAITWSLVCVGILGAGIIMGGFWAYESLSFGGYWAWDPVENASLMPWLIMASASHMLLISKSTGRHLFTAHLLVQLSFWLVLYATFLTRSGILGEASVHSFTDLGLSGQLLILLLSIMLLSVLSALQKPRWQWSVIGGFVLLVIVFSLLTLFGGKTNQAQLTAVMKWTGVVVFIGVFGLFIYKLYSRTRTEQDDERWLSRELWMFIGAMFLILSLVQVFSATSIPVFNKLFGFSKAPAKPEEYNAFQLWLAMPVMLLMAIGQYFRWRDTDPKVLKKQLLQVLLISVVLTLLVNLNFGINEPKYLLFLLVGMMLFIANVLYLRHQKKLQWLAWGGSVAHAGFGVLLVGVLVSSVNQKILTSSEGIRFASELNKDGKVDEKAVKFNRENVILYQNQPVQLGEFKATYQSVLQGKDNDSIDKYFKVFFTKLNKDGTLADSFTLLPKTQNNPKMGLLAEPSTRHFISRDIFTHVNYESSLEKKEPFSDFKETVAAPGETFLTESGKVKLRIDSVKRFNSEDGAAGVELRITAIRLQDSTVLFPKFVVNLSRNDFSSIPSLSSELGVLTDIVNIEIPEPGQSADQVRFLIKTGERSPQKNYIVIKAIEFPWINLVWAGTIIMVVGFTMAVVYRVKQNAAA
jgi:cytochrome c-type biogenesis protein CcmF